MKKVFSVMFSMFIFLTMSYFIIGCQKAEEKRQADSPKKEVTAPAKKTPDSTPEPAKKIPPQSQSKTDSPIPAVVEKTDRVGDSKNRTKVSLKEKVSTVSGKPSPADKVIKEIDRDNRFIAYSNGTVLDTQTNLMWVAKDNGTDIKWQDAKSYCDNNRQGGYKDWRMPSQDELAGLFDGPSKGYKAKCCLECPNIKVTNLIELSCFWLWGAETRSFDAAGLLFDDGKQYWGRQSFSGNYRVLPVRSGR